MDNGHKYADNNSAYLRCTSRSFQSFHLRKKSLTYSILEVDHPTIALCGECVATPSDGRVWWGDLESKKYLQGDKRGEAGWIMDNSKRRKPTQLHFWI